MHFDRRGAFIGRRRWRYHAKGSVEDRLRELVRETLTQANESDHENGQQHSAVFFLLRPTVAEKKIRKSGGGRKLLTAQVLQGTTNRLWMGHRPPSWFPPADCGFPSPTVYIRLGTDK